MVNKGGRPIGYPKTGGVKLGSKSPKRLLPLTVSEKLEDRASIKARFKIMPLDYLMQVLNDESNDREIRMQAAIAAAPYVHARLSAIEHKQDAPFVQEVRFTVIEGIAREIDVEDDTVRLQVQ